MLNSNSPIMDPCGNPKIISDHEIMKLFQKIISDKEWLLLLIQNPVEYLR